MLSFSMLSTSDMKSYKVYSLRTSFLCEKKTIGVCSKVKAPRD